MAGWASQSHSKNLSKNSTGDVLSNAATSRVTSDQNEIISEIRIVASAQRVFQALVDPQLVLQWWGQQGVYQCKEFTSDLHPGGKWRSSGVGPDGGPFEVIGEYLEVDPPRLLVHTWIASWTGEAKTTVRWELESAGATTLLRIRHSGLAAHTGISQSYRGWPRMLEWIRVLLEQR